VKGINMVDIESCYCFSPKK